MTLKCWPAVVSVTEATLQFTEPKLSVAFILVPDTTAHFQGASGVCALTVPKKGINAILRRST